jgi:hypothetical protein
MLKGVAEHAAELEKHKVRLGDPLGADSQIVNTTKQIFRAVLDKELGLRVSAFDQDEKEEALELQLERSDQSQDESVDVILELFGELCDRWPEVLDLRYGGTRADFREFRTAFLPALLEALDLWAKERKDDALSNGVATLEQRYRKAIRRAERAQREAGDEDEE